MTAEPSAPGAPAIYLYRQVDRDDANNREVTYERIKILTEEGRKYADVEIPFLKEKDRIRGIKARTVQADGTIVNFDSKVYEKTIVKAKGWKYLAETFTMPDVRVGSIIEYRYTDEIVSGYVYDSYWTLSSELFTRLARFSLKPTYFAPLQWSWPNGLPAGTKPPSNEHGVIRLETQNVPAFQTEDYMPPVRELKYRVDFIYEIEAIETDPVKFWQKFGKARFERGEDFLNKKKAMEEALASIVQPNDDADTKLRKIYARVQQMDNYSFEREKTQQEAKREKRRNISKVDDVWKQAGGYGAALNYLFVGLVRAAGMEAYDVAVSTRDSYFFNPRVMNTSHLNNDVVLVRVGGKDLYFDPGTPHVPYGLLPWYESDVGGLRPAKDGGSWIQTPLPDSSESKIERKAELQLSDDGMLEGKLRVTYTGLQAFEMRRDGDDEDDASRKKILEDSVREVVPVNIEVSLTNKPDWDGSSPTFMAEYTIKIPGWVSGAGRRALMPTGLFSEGEKHVFEHANRVHPIYFHYLYSKVDDVTVTMPLGWKIGNLPAPIDQDRKGVAYTSKAEQREGSLHILRTLRMNVLQVDAANYRVLRDFFQSVRSGDDQQIVLQPIG